MSLPPQVCDRPFSTHFLRANRRRAGRVCRSAKAYPTAGPWPPRPRECVSSPSATARKAATSSCWQLLTRVGIRDLDRLKSATAALADPRRTDPAAAERLIADARPIYYFNAALHSDETGSTEAMLEMAYRLAVSEQPMFQRIRQQLVVLINPVSNPDGRDKVVEWFYRYLKGKTDAQHSAPPVASLLVEVRIR